MSPKRGFLEAGRPVPCLGGRTGAERQACITQPRIRGTGPMDDGRGRRPEGGRPAESLGGPGDGLPDGGPLGLSVVVPCYNEAETLPELHRRVTDACAALGLSYEILLVNDGSTDASWPILAALAQKDSHMLVINLSRNHGHQLALTAGLAYCRGDRILIIDADLQDPPELIPDMVRLLDGGKDVVYGRRRARQGEGLFKRLTATLFYRAIGRLTDISIPRDTGDFRVMNRRVLDVFLAMPERHRFIRGMISWTGFRQEPFLYDRQARFAGSTKYPLRKMIRFAIDAITAFSIKPLALASWLGIATGLVACPLSLYTLVSWVQGKTVVGWTSLMAVIVLFGSVQLVILGIFGEYLGRMYDEMKGRPLFIVESVVRGDRLNDHSPGKDEWIDAPLPEGPS